MIKFVFLFIAIVALSVFAYSSIALLRLKKIEERKMPEDAPEESHGNRIQRLRKNVVALVSILGVCNHGKSLDKANKIQKYTPRELGL